MNLHTEILVDREQLSIKNLLPKLSFENIRDEILTGLESNPKHISSKYFYDKKGSELFEEITKLKEYYPTRTEKSILRQYLPTIFKDLSDTSIIELGSGDSSKISILFDSISDQYINSNLYVPIDFSYSAIKQSASTISKHYPGISIEGFVADFMTQLDQLPKHNQTLFCFFGSTIGNMSREQSYEFLKNLGTNMRKRDQLLLGLDMVKDIPLLEKAYNDNLGVTEAFNKNILVSINDIIGTDFQEDDFDHLAFFNPKESRIEMHLKAKRFITTTSPFRERPIVIHESELIHTEDSHKFTNEHIKEMAGYAGLIKKSIFTDPKNWFSLVHFVK